VRTHHPHPGLARAATKAAVFTVVSLLITTVVVSSLLDLNGQSAKGYSAVFSNASGLQPGDTVRIAGVEVGKVGGVTLQGHHALVSFSLDDSQHLTTTSRAAIHFENLLGQRFLALLPGAGKGRPLRPGAEIPESHTKPAIDLTAVFDGFQPLFSALSPDQVNQLAGSLVAILQGQGGTVSDLVAQVATLTDNLADRQQIIDALLDSLASLLNTVGVHDHQLGQLIGNFDTLVRGLAGSRAQLGSAVDNLASAESQTSHLVDEAQPTLNEDIQHLSGAVKVLSQHQHGLSGVLEGLPGLLTTLTKVQSSGNWINVYLCNLTVDVHGSLDISLIPGVSPTSPEGRYPNPVVLPSGTIGDQSQHTASCS
jgi:phospholipid/cholesterol/gamma-HCH transport system substrate-binding protein